MSKLSLGGLYSIYKKLGFKVFRGLTKPPIISVQLIIELSEDQESRCLTSIYKQVKNGLDQLEPRLSAELIFGNFINQEIQSP